MISLRAVVYYLCPASLPHKCLFMRTNDLLEHVPDHKLLLPISAAHASMTSLAALSTGSPLYLPDVSLHSPLHPLAYWHPHVWEDFHAAVATHKSGSVVIRAASWTPSCLCRFCTLLHSRGTGSMCGENGKSIFRLLV